MSGRQMIDDVVAPLLSALAIAAFAAVLAMAMACP
jgi:hypothetical protein